MLYRHDILKVYGQESHEHPEYYLMVASKVTDRKRNNGDFAYPKCLAQSDVIGQKTKGLNNQPDHNGRGN